jgi:hypothetical protein
VLPATTLVDNDGSCPGVLFGSDNNSALKIDTPKIAVSWLAVRCGTDVEIRYTLSLFDDHEEQRRD